MDDLTRMKVDAILDERRQRRDEILLFERVLLNFGPLLVTVLSGAFIAFLGKEHPLPMISENRGLILGFLNQLLFFLGLITTLILINMTGQARYVANLEKNLNRLLEERVCVWESSGTVIKHSAYLFLSVVLFLTVSAGFVFLAYLTFQHVHSYWLLAVNVLQLLVVWSAQICDLIWSEKKQQTWFSSYRSAREAEPSNPADS